MLAAFSPDGRSLAGRARADKTIVKIWNVADGKESLTLPQATNYRSSSCVLAATVNAW